MVELETRTVITGRTVNFVPPSGFEPEIYALRRRRPRPLDDGGGIHFQPQFYQFTLDIATQMRYNF